MCSDKWGQRVAPLLAFYANYVYYQSISGSDKQNHLYPPTLPNLGKELQYETSIQCSSIATFIIILIILVVFWSEYYGVFGVGLHSELIKATI